MGWDGYLGSGFAHLLPDLSGSGGRSTPRCEGYIEAMDDNEELYGSHYIDEQTTGTDLDCSKYIKEKPWHGKQE